MTWLLTLKSLNIYITIHDGGFLKSGYIEINDVLHFPCNADKNKATNKKYTSNERNFFIFYEKIPNLDDRGYRAFKIDILQLGNFLQFFSTNLEKIENINFYIFP